MARVSGPPRGVPLSGAHRMRAEATVQSGYSATGHWPLLLDGILAAAAHRRRLGEHYGGDVDHHTETLPLCRATAGAGKQWWWMATSGHPVDRPDGLDGTDVRWWHRRVAHDRALDVCGPHVPVTIREAARLKTWRMPQPITVCSRVEWRAVGDPAGVKDLLGDVESLGAKRGQGEGAVVRWRVEDLGPAGDDAARWVAWAWGGVSRPIPARCAAEIGAGHADVIPGVVRPPYWRPPQTGRDGGGFGRGWRDVIAPWATRGA